MKIEAIIGKLLRNETKNKKKHKNVKNIKKHKNVKTQKTQKKTKKRKEMQKMQNKSRQLLVLEYLFLEYSLSKLTQVYKYGV